MTQQTTSTRIKMIARNPQTRQLEEVFPEDEVAMSEMIPFFYCGGADRYVTVPGYEAEDVYNEWLDQLRKAK